MKVKKKKVNKAYDPVKQKLYRDSNPDVMRAIKRRACIKNRDAVMSYSAQWAKDNPRKRAAIARNAHLKRSYGIDQAAYERLFQLQGRACGICHSDNNGRSLHVDHNHITGVVAGLLCGRCNTAIGLLREDPAIVHRANIWVMCKGRSCG